MTAETWVAFCAAAILIALVPSPAASLIARFAVQKGRRSALVTVPGVALGMGAALTVAALPVAAIVWAAPSLREPLSWLGLAYFLLYILWSFQEPSARAPLASNDNLPQQRPLGIFVHLFRGCLATGRYVVILAALLTQFLGPVMAAPALALEMQAAFLLAVTVGATLHALFPHRTLNRLRRPAPRHPASHKMQTRYIARRAVSAGFRRIAA
jgi:threonine/homoserine/homoserine lactone efflux protein